MVKTRGLFFFRAKKSKKVNITADFADFPGPAYGPKVTFSISKCSLMG